MKAENFNVPFPPFFGRVQVSSSVKVGLKFSYLKIKDQMGVANFYLSNQIFALNKDPTFLRINEFLKKIRCSRISNQKFGQF